jgi:hypothetical protein
MVHCTQRLLEALFWQDCWPSSFEAKKRDPVKGAAVSHDQVTATTVASRPRKVIRSENLSPAEFHRARMPTVRNIGSMTGEKAESHA